MLNLDLQTENREWPFTSVKGPIKWEFLGSIKYFHFTVPCGLLFLYLQHLFRTAVEFHEGRDLDATGIPSVDTFIVSVALS